jgi:DNA repair protein RadC
MNNQIVTPSFAAALFYAALPATAKEERLFVLPLDGNGKALAKPILVSVGHEDGTAQIDVGAIFREAFKAGAEEIIVAHNHPSGKLTPSKADLRLTEELKTRAEWLGLGFLDHIILGASKSEKGFDFISLAEIM